MTMPPRYVRGPEGKIVAVPASVVPPEPVPEEEVIAPEEKIREVLAKLEHEQWVKWSQAVADEVSSSRKARWEKMWIPYSELTEEQKDQDRIWADRVLISLKERGILTTQGMSVDGAFPGAPVYNEEVKRPVKRTQKAKRKPRRSEREFSDILEVRGEV